MKKLLYIHGFGSSGASGTVKLLREKLYPIGMSVVAPDVPLFASKAMPFLQELVAKEQPDLILGTSMGGMYAERLRGYKRILVNPSFILSKSLVKFGFGKKEWMNKRADGEKFYKIDKALVDDFKEFEKSLFADLSEEDKALVWGFFGTEDTLVNFQQEFRNVYGDEHFRTFQGEHRLNDHALSRYILPTIEDMVKEL